MSRICPICGTGSMPTRRDARVCSSTCRAEATRLRDIRERYNGVPVSHVVVMLERLEQPETASKALSHHASV
jgi:predicted nucleic acid-binding Zn ribbon protein